MACPGPLKEKDPYPPGWEEHKERSHGREIAGSHFTHLRKYLNLALRIIPPGMKRPTRVIITP